MVEELQSLLEKIQKEGVEKARSEAEKILAEARNSAAGIIAEAERKAEMVLKKAESDAADLTERGRRGLEQAARDVILSVGESINIVFQELARKEAAKALAGDTLQKMLEQVVASYLQSRQAGVRLEILLSPAQTEEVSSFLLHKFGEKLRSGVDIIADRSLAAGFKARVEGGRMQHDFTDMAIAESLSKLLRPQLAEIVRQATSSLPTRQKTQ